MVGFGTRAKESNQLAHDLQSKTKQKENPERDKSKENSTDLESFQVLHHRKHGNTTRSYFPDDIAEEERLIQYARKRIHVCS
jgi:hypothetical protein